MGAIVILLMTIGFFIGLGALLAGLLLGSAFLILKPLIIAAAIFATVYYGAIGLIAVGQAIADCCEESDLLENISETFNACCDSIRNCFSSLFCCSDKATPPITEYDFTDKPTESTTCCSRLTDLCSGIYNMLPGFCCFRTRGDNERVAPNTEYDTKPGAGRSLTP